MSRLKDKLRNVLKHVLSPVFLGLLAVSFMLWYIIKLSYTYTTEMPINILVDGQKLRVTCVVQGQGSTLQRFRMFSRINVKRSELAVSPSPDNPDMLVISPQSLEKAISVKSNDFKILSITDIPLLPVATGTEE